MIRNKLFIVAAAAIATAATTATTTNTSPTTTAATTSSAATTPNITNATSAQPPSQPLVELPFEWNAGLIAVSYLVAVAASYSTVTLLQLRLHPGMVVLGAFTLSVAGIWSMHFIGMEALHVGVAMGFEPVLTAASALFAFACTAPAMALVHWRVSEHMVAMTNQHHHHVAAGAIDVSVKAHVRALRHAPHGTLVLSGALIAAGVCSMHYGGMAAMQLEGVARTEALPGVIAASVAIAVAAATAALYLAFVLPLSRRFALPTACVMGVAVCGMHYTGIHGFRYLADPASPAFLAARRHEHRTELTPYVVCGSMLVSMLTLAYTSLRYQSMIEAAVQKFELYVPPAIVASVFLNEAKRTNDQATGSATAAGPHNTRHGSCASSPASSLRSGNGPRRASVVGGEAAASSFRVLARDWSPSADGRRSAKYESHAAATDPHAVAEPSVNDADDDDDDDERADAPRAGANSGPPRSFRRAARERDVDPYAPAVDNDSTVTVRFGSVNWLDLKMRPANASVMFIDVVDFTSHAERMTQAGLLREMTAFNGRCTDVIEATGGLVDKYLGDAIMAVWNTVQPVPDHGLRAVAAAARCVEGGAAAEGLVFEAKAGVQSGPVLMGNVGSATKRNFTVLGDTVNQASRIEGLTRHYGARVMIGRGTREQLGADGGGFVVRFLDEAVLKGKAKSVLLYEVMADAAAHCGSAVAVDVATARTQVFDQHRWEETYPDDPLEDSQAVPIPRSGNRNTAVEQRVRRAELIAAAYELLHERFRSGNYTDVVATLSPTHDPEEFASSRRSPGFNASSTSMVSVSPIGLISSPNPLRTRPSQQQQPRSQHSSVAVAAWQQTLAEIAACVVGEDIVAPPAAPSTPSRAAAIVSLLPTTVASLESADHPAAAKNAEPSTARPPPQRTAASIVCDLLRDDRPAQLLRERAAELLTSEEEESLMMVATDEGVAASSLPDAGTLPPACIGKNGRGAASIPSPTRHQRQAAARASVMRFTSKE